MVMKFRCVGRLMSNLALTQSTEIWIFLTDMASYLPRPCVPCRAGQWGCLSRSSSKIHPLMRTIHLCFPKAWCITVASHSQEPICLLVAWPSPSWRTQVWGSQTSPSTTTSEPSFILGTNVANRGSEWRHIPQGYTLWTTTTFSPLEKAASHSLTGQPEGPH